MSKKIKTITFLLIVAKPYISQLWHDLQCLRPVSMVFKMGHYIIVALILLEKIAKELTWKIFKNPDFVNFSRGLFLLNFQLNSRPKNDV